MKPQFRVGMVASLLFAAAGLALADPPDPLDENTPAFGDEDYFARPPEPSQRVEDEGEEHDAGVREGTAAAVAATAHVGDPITDSLQRPVVASASLYFPMEPEDEDAATAEPAGQPDPVSTVSTPAVKAVASGSVADSIRPVAAATIPAPLVIGEGCDASGCDVAGCDGNCPKLKHDPRCPKTWAQFEALLWFVQDRDAPPLVTTAPESELPILGLNGVQTAFGDDISGGLSAGFRADAGRYLTDRFGVGGRFWIISESEDSLDLSGDGTGRSIGIPFYDIASDAENAILVNTNGTGIPLTTFLGDVEAEGSVEMLAAEAYARLCFHDSKCSHLDLLGGYSHFSVDDMLSLQSRIVNGEASANPIGTVRQFRDVFETENRFHGGQIGFETILTHKRWMLRTLTKVHLGNMNQQVSIEGSSTRQVPAGSVDETDGGIFAQGNQGEFERDEFAFIPEANVKLAYRFREHVLFSVGYSFLYFDSVALAGDLLDRELSDATNLNTGAPFGPRPTFVFDDTSLWVQGIDLGIIIDY